MDLLHGIEPKFVLSIFFQDKKAKLGKNLLVLAPTLSGRILSSVLTIVNKTILRGFYFGALLKIAHVGPDGPTLVDIVLCCFCYRF